MVLQHGTLPLSGDITRIFDVLALDEAEKPELRRQLVERATTLEAELGEAISFERAAEAMAQGFAQMLNLKLEPGSLTDQETTLVAQLRTDTYLSDAWNKRF
jgi:lipoate-protein ligase A